MIKVVNLVPNRNHGPGFIRADRVSPLGNPYLLQDEEDRELIIKLYKRYLWCAMNQPYGRDRQASIIADTTRKKHHLHIRLAPAYLAKRWTIFNVQAELNALVHRHMRGEDVILGCWCHPSPCHCDILKAAIEWKAAENVQHAMEAM